MKWRIMYGLLCALVILAFSLPWQRMGGKVFTGWQFVLPFSWPYLIGIMLALVVLFTGYGAVRLTIMAGVLMLLGTFGGMVGAGMHRGLAKVTGGTEAEIGGGLALAFIMSLLYPILGSIAGNQFKEAHVTVELK